MTEFTKRQNDVIPFLMEGSTNATIAKALNLKVVTIKLHIRAICKKLEATNRTQAAVKLVRNSLLNNAA